MQPSETTEESVDARVARVHGVIALLFEGARLAESFHVLVDHALVWVIEHQQYAVGFLPAF